MSFPVNSTTSDFPCRSYGSTCFKSYAQTGLMQFLVSDLTGNLLALVFISISLLLLEFPLRF